MNEPAVIVIDEIDALCGLRQERRVVGALCGEMERVCGEDRRVVVVGATNRVGAVDPSLRRGGRFDVEIEIGEGEGRGGRALCVCVCVFVCLCVCVESGPIQRAHKPHTQTTHTTTPQPTRAHSGIPNSGQRHEILVHLLSGFSHRISADVIASAAATTHGFVGADLAQVCVCCVAPSPSPPTHTPTHTHTGRS